MGYNDDELTIEELNEIKAGIIKGQDVEMLNKLSRKELEQLRDHFVERELSDTDLENVKAAIPYEEGKNIASEHPEIFRNK